MPKLVSKEEAERARDALLKRYRAHLSEAGLFKNERGHWVVMLYLPHPVGRGTLPHEYLGVRIYHEVVGDARTG